MSSKEALQAQVELIEQVDPKQKGKFAGGVGGQDALKAAAGSRDADAAAPIEKFGAPLVLMEAPSSINWATPASTVVFAGEQLQWTTQADLHMAAAYTVASVSANATGLFTHDGGIQAVAANGPVSLQAHTDQLEILADKAVTIVSVNDVIEIKASEKIVLQAGQSSITLVGGDITFACPGNFTVKGGQHLFDSGTADNAKLDDLPNKLITPKPELHSLRWAAISAFTGKMLPEVNVVALNLDTGKVAFEGQTTGDGRSARQRDEKKAQQYSAMIGSGGWVTEITTDEDPEVLENEEWMDQEAEDE